MKAIDLFAGAGGVTQGLKNAGYSVLAAVEKDDFAGRTYHKNHPEVDLRNYDIEDIDPEQFRRDLKLKKEELDLLTACPPCQGFSSLGKGDVDDVRNDLVLNVWGFVRSFRPKVVMIENVPGLESDNRLKTLSRKIRSAGYGLRTWKVQAVKFGVPQRRTRLILLAVRGVLSKNLPVQLHESLPGHFDADEKSVRDAFALIDKLVLPEDPLHMPRVHSANVVERIKAIPIGGDRYDLPEHLQLECHKRLKKASSASGSYARLKYDEPAPTLTTRCITPSSGPFIHPEKHRGITLREAATLQTFPCDYQFIGYKQDIERQIGNALPVKLAEGLGYIVAEMLSNK